MLSLRFFIANKILHKPVKHRGINFYDRAGYFLLLNPERIEKIEKLNDNEYIIIVKDLGKFYIKNDIWPVLYYLQNEYEILDVKDKVVLDIGAYVGDSSIYFIRKGARKVYVYEAVKDFYEILLKNIELNDLQDKIIPINKGIDCNKGENYIKININNRGESGSEYGNYKIELTSIKDVFEEIYNKEEEFVTKMDCEGCEYSLLCLPDEVLKYSREYIIEIHGSPQVLISKFLRNGYKMKIVKKDSWYLGVYYFYR
ncbi:MAG: FkbM family methyltransferase [Nanopusillaceae archaeon]